METSEHISFINTLLPFTAVVFIIAIGVVLLSQQFRQNLYKQKLEQEELKSKHQIELLRYSIQVQEDERKRIARDLHDELGAVLSILRMHLVQLEHVPPKDTLPEKLSNLRGLTENAIANMRRISHELMPPQLETFGLVKALESLIHQIETTGKIDIQLHTEGATETMDWPVNLALYRVFLELITNSLKHAGATKIVFSIKRDEKELKCMYTDNGKGLTLNDTPGIGLKSMEGRIKSLSGQFRFGNHEEGGFLAEIIIPLPEHGNY